MKSNPPITSGQARQRRLEFPSRRARTTTTSTIKTTFLLLALLASQTSASIVLNGDFSTSSANWSPYDNNVATAVGLDYSAPGESGAAGDYALRVTSRDDATEGVKQDVIGALTAGAGLNGRSIVTRLSVRLDAYASVRCLLVFKDQNNTVFRPILLAEQVVRTVGQWVHLEGVSTLAWTGSPTKALVVFEIQQYESSVSPAAVPLPAYEIDNLTIDFDDDSDGLSNTEETSRLPPLAIDNPDTDGDHLPDGWEVAHGTNPNVPDAHADLDGDGFTNIEEYFAATDPNGPQTPGVPANVHADAPTCALLRYLALAPSRRYLPDGTTGRHVLTGQMVSESLPDNAALPEAFANNVSRLATDTGRWPAIVGFAAEGGVSPMQIHEAADEAAAWLQDGGIVQIKFRPWNPWTNTSNDTSGVNIPELIGDPSSPAYILFHDWLDQIATELARLKDPAQGGRADAVILFRPFSEMNGAWFWWGHLSREDYEALWRHVYNYFTVTHGLNHLLWVYESAISEHAPVSEWAATTASDYYYPGDDVVDVMGHNLYSDTWDLDFDEFAVYSRYPKVTGIPQAGSSNPASNGIHRAAGTFDNLTYLEKIQTRYPRISFFIVWNSMSGGALGYQHVAIVDNLHPTELMTHPEIITRDDLDWLPPTLTPISAPVLGLSGKLKRVTRHRRLALRGWSTDAIRVEYRLTGKSAYRSTHGSAHWKVTARLQPGRNTITLRAIAADGRLSPTTKLTVVRKP